MLLSFYAFEGGLVFECVDGFRIFNVLMKRKGKRWETRGWFVEVSSPALDGLTTPPSSPGFGMAEACSPIDWKGPMMPGFVTRP